MPKNNLIQACYKKFPNAKKATVISNKTEYGEKLVGKEVIVYKNDAGLSECVVVKPYKQKGFTGGYFTVKLILVPTSTLKFNE